MATSKRKQVRPETLLFVLSGAALVVVLAGGGMAAPAPAAGSTASDRLDDVPVIAATLQPGATIEVSNHLRVGRSGEIGVAAGPLVASGAERESTQGSASGPSAGR
jgi:hypothetical protein